MKNIFIALLCTIVFTLSMSAKPQSRDTTMKDLGSTTTGPLTTAKYQDSRTNDNEEFDTMERIMNECNETFRIELAYLESLNDSGSFTDETDRTPKCYIRCMLEKMEILSEDDGTLNPARAAVIFAGERNGKPMEDIADMTALCADRKETCRCEKAYQFMRCLMSMEIARYEESQ